MGALNKSPKPPKTKKAKTLNDKFCSCKKKVSAKNSKVNEYAVCTASVYGSRGMKRPAGAMKYCDSKSKSTKANSTTSRAKILNPATGRMVLRDGKIGREITNPNRKKVKNPNRKKVKNPKKKASRSPRRK